MNNLESLQDARLLECYNEAVKFQLDEEFIRIILNEVERRKLTIRN